MINSMTGYGRGQYTADNLEITLEIKSVNHRYFEFSARTPRVYAFLEEKLKSYFSSRISRGKTDVFVSIENSGDDSAEVEVNEALATAYVEALRKLRDDYNLADDISVSTLARNNDIFKIRKKELDEDVVWSAVSSAADLAFTAFIKMRGEEGARLVTDVTQRTAEIIKHVEYIESKSPETVKAYRERIETKMRELIGDKQIDENRLITETAIFADKVAVDEETVRLRSHIEQLGDLLKSGEAVGRKLDFVIQEMNREANTIGSKAQDVEITRRVVEIKSQIEKIREQIQNIE